MYGKWIWDAILEAEDKRVNAYIYLIQGTTGGPIKLGWSKVPRARLSVLQTANPHPLRMLTYFPATKHREADLHAMFESYRHHGEWFKATKSILEFADTGAAIMKWLSDHSAMYMQPNGRIRVMPTDEWIGALDSVA
jgi:Meiotically Up-regulated Gene 113 (MUG113) protein